MSAVLDQKALVQDAVLLEHARREAKRIVDAEEQRREEVRLLDVKELFAQTDPDYLIDELLPEFSLSEIVGDSGSLKSFFAIHLGLTIATEQKGFEEFFGLKVVKHGPVIYIAAEGGGSFKHRVRAWGQAHHVDIQNVPFYTIKSPVNLRDPWFQERFTALAAETTPVLVIVDTRHRCTPGSNENSSQDMGEVVAFAQTLQSDHHVAVMFIHHPSGSSATGRGRGSTAVFNALDTEIQASVVEEEDGIKTLKFRVTKQKDDHEVTLNLRNRIVQIHNGLGKALTFKSGRVVETCVLEQVSEEEQFRKQLEWKDRITTEILAFVRAHPGATRTAVRQSVKGKEKTVTEFIDHLASDGRLRTERKGTSTKLFVVDEDAEAAANGLF